MQGLSGRTFLIFFLISLQTFPFTLRGSHLLRVLPLISKMISSFHLVYSVTVPWILSSSCPKSLKAHQIFPAPQSWAVSEYTQYAITWFIFLNLHFSSRNLEKVYKTPSLMLSHFVLMQMRPFKPRKVTCPRPSTPPATNLHLVSLLSCPASSPLLSQPSVPVELGFLVFSKPVMTQRALTGLLGSTPRVVSGLRGERVPCEDACGTCIMCWCESVWVRVQSLHQLLKGFSGDPPPKKWLKLILYTGFLPPSVLSAPPNLRRNALLCLFSSELKTKYWHWDFADLPPHYSLIVLFFPSINSKGEKPVYS